MFFVKREKGILLFLFWLFLMYLNAAFTRYDNARPKSIILNFKNKIYFFNF